MSESNGSMGCLQFFAALLIAGLTVLFVGLKLGGIIEWSWWLVLLPLWGPAVLFAVAFCVAVAIAVVALAIAKDRSR